VSTSSSSAKRSYRCANRDGAVKHVTRQAEPLDAWVEELLIERLSRKGTVEKLLRRKDTADVAKLRIEQVGLSERKDKLASDWALGALDDRQVKLANKQIDDRLAEIAATLAKVGWRSPLEPLARGDIRKTWATLSLAQKRAILGAVCDVTVLPTKPTTRGLDVDAVRVDWRVG
jgi:site-specific DNA recombinase